MTSLPARGLGPFEKNHPLVEQGMAAYQRGDFEAALRHFEQAQKQLPASAALDFDRANALFKLGRLDEARSLYEKVASTGEKELQQKGLYNLGNTLATMGQSKEAISAYRRALKLDPGDDQARHNLEVLLRKLPPPAQAPDGGSPDGGAQDGGARDGGARDGGAPDGGTDGGERARDGGSADGGSEEGRSPEQADGGAADGGGADAGRAGQGQSNPPDGGSDAGEEPEPTPGSEGEDAGVADGGAESTAGLYERDGGVDGGAEAALSKSEAEKLLDSMKQSEKNLQLWRFQQKRSRKRHDKDW